MKRIVLLLTLFFLSFAEVFSASIELNSEASEVQMWDSFDVFIDVERQDAEQVSIETISWIENFSILGQSNSERYVNINGEVQTQTKILFTLQPKMTGSFELWPVNGSASWAVITSNTVSIEVIWEESSTDDIVSSENSDILDIFEETESNISLRWYPLLVLVFLFLFYVLIAKFMKKQTSIPIEVEETPSQNEILISKLRKLKRSASKQEKAQFYGSCNEIIRDFLATSWYKNAEKMTLKEIKTLDIANTELVWLFEESYKREFDTRKDTPESRKKLIDDFIVQLKA